MAGVLISQEYIGSLCEIKSLDNQLIDIGRISQISSKYIRIEKKTGDLRIVSYGSEVKVNIFNNKSGFKVILGKVFTSSRSEISISDMSALVEYERRNFFRVDMDTRVRCLVDKTMQTEMIIKDMSMTGTRISMGRALSPDSMIVFEIEIGPGKRVQIVCKVKHSLGFKKDRYEYGCQIIPTRTFLQYQDAYSSFLLMKQREFLKGGK